MELVTYKKYLDTLHEEFPDVDKKSIRDVVRHGLTMMGIFKERDFDIYLNNNRENLYYYFGKATHNMDDRYERHYKKIRKKLRLIYRLKKTIYSGYYYFALNDERYAKYLAKEPIDIVYLYKIQEESDMAKKNKHKFRIKMDEVPDFFIKKENYETNFAEYIC